MKKLRDYTDIIHSLKKICTNDPYKMAKIGRFSANKELKYDFFEITAIKNKNNPYIFLSAGVHGSEPAGVYAIMEFLSNRIRNYYEEYNFHIIPCVNPYGFEHNERKNANEKNLNRGFKKKVAEKEIEFVKNALKSHSLEYLAAIDLHEDNHMDILDTCKDQDKRKRPKGFYMYESQENKKLRIGLSILDELKNTTPICKKKTVYDDKNHNGVIWYPEDLKNAVYKDGTTLDSYLLMHYTNHAFIFETPAQWDMKKRIETHIKAIRIVLDLKR